MTAISPGQTKKTILAYNSVSDIRDTFLNNHALETSLTSNNGPAIGSFFANGFSKRLRTKKLNSTDIQDRMDHVESGRLPDD